MHPQLELIASLHHGILTHRQVREHCSQKRVDWLIATKRLLPIFSNTYRVAGAPLTFEARIYAATCAASVGAVASHQSALRLHGLTQSEEELHVTVAASRSNQNRAIHVHRGRIDGYQRVVVSGVACTTIERTVMDAATFMRLGQLARLMDEAVARGLTDFSKLQTAFEKMPKQGRKGISNLRTLLTERLAIAKHIKGHLALRVGKVLSRMQITQPMGEVTLWDGPQDYYLDFAWLRQRIGIECEGFQFHDKSRKQFDYERRRRNFLTIEDWIIVYIVATMKNVEIEAAILGAFALRNNEVSTFVTKSQ